MRKSCYKETITMMTGLGGTFIILAIILPELPWKKFSSTWEVV